MKPKTALARALWIGCLLVAHGTIEPAWAAFPGQNGKIAFTSNRDGGVAVYVMDADGSNPTNLTAGPGADADPAWSPDGTRIAFTTSRIVDGSIEIYAMNADGTDQTNLTHSAGIDFQPAWSPDGAQIAYLFQATRVDQTEIYAMDADGTNQINLTNFAGTDLDAAWSPDGTKIAFTANRDAGAAEIYVMDADGSNPTNLTNNAANDIQPSWSPDGTKIAFASNRDGLGDIYVMDADGSNPVNITNNQAGNSQPEWAPDGTKIAFRSFRDGNLEIYVMDADGTDQTNLTNNAADDEGPRWQRVLGGNDSDGDGIPDDQDVEGIQEAIEGLSSSAFKKGNGFANALNSILDDVEAAVALGDTAAAVQMLENLRHHVDGCHPKADKNDWIVDCSAQVEIRELIDTLISNLEG